MVAPDDIEYFYTTSNRAGLEVHHYQDTERYWIFAGQGSIQVLEEDLPDLATILSSYQSERFKSPIRRWALRLLLISATAFTIIILTAQGALS